MDSPRPRGRTDGPVRACDSLGTGQPPIEAERKRGPTRSCVPPGVTDGCLPSIKRSSHCSTHSIQTVRRIWRNPHSFAGETCASLAPRGPPSWPSGAGGGGEAACGQWPPGGSVAVWCRRFPACRALGCPPRRRLPSPERA
eukprot:scaffold2730_cov247-Pinguiococcus_pyrenoidosus.AAC.15